VSGWRAFSADGHDVRWTTWDGEHEEHLTLRWENEGWTACGDVGRERVQYVLRLGPTWRVRQLLLFRDLDEPDLWLATDGHNRWGEMNGAHRPELDGCADIELSCSPFPATLPIRRLPLEIGDSAEMPVVIVDVDTLAVDAVGRRFERLADRRWRQTDTSRGDGEAVEYDVDEYGVVVDHPGRFRRSR
jgi:uncharacterized protein